MRRRTFVFPLFFVSLMLTSLACVVFVGGPDYSNLPPIPVSADAAASIQTEIQRAVQAAAGTGVITVNLTEPQITSYLAERLQSDPSLQQPDKKPLIADPQVYLRDGQMQIYGKTQQGIFTANLGVIVDMGVDANGQPKIDIASADFGPLPAPQGLKDAVTAMVSEAYTGSLGPVATGIRIESISIANGVMTVTGRIR